MQRVNSNFFINNLLYPLHPRTGAIKVAPKLSAAAVTVMESAMSASRRLLATYIDTGERAHAQRNVDALRLVGDSILELPLVGASSLIGRYYQALAINRQGPQAYPRANKLLLEVADRAPAIFRAKARVALGTNANICGDKKTAESMYAEALTIIGSCGQGGLHPTFLIRFQHAYFKTSKGDHRGALEDLEKLAPLAQLIGQRYPALLQLYYNNLAMGLLRAGRIDEAELLCRILAASPFKRAYPEWGEPLALLASKRQQPLGQAQVTGAGFARSTPVAVRQHTNVFLLPTTGASAIAPEEGSPADSHRKRGRVLDFTGWIGRKTQTTTLHSAPKIKLTRNRIRQMSTQQKQAAILKLVLSDEIKDLELNRLLDILCEDTPQPVS